MRDLRWRQSLSTPKKSVSFTTKTGDVESEGRKEGIRPNAWRPPPPPTPPSARGKNTRRRGGKNRDWRQPWLLRRRPSSALFLSPTSTKTKRNMRARAEARHSWTRIKEKESPRNGGRDRPSGAGLKGGIDVMGRRRGSGFGRVPRVKRLPGRYSLGNGIGAVGKSSAANGRNGGAEQMKAEPLGGGGGAATLQAINWYRGTTRMQLGSFQI